MTGTVGTQRPKKKSKPVGRKPRDPDTSTYRGRFGANLRRLREKRFETQDNFVDALKKRGFASHKMTVSGWENGNRLPALDILPIIAETLQVSVRSLLPLK